MKTSWGASVIHVGDCLAGLSKVENRSIACAIADPPYFKVLGGKDSWDYQWRTKDEYLSWCSQWFQEVFRVLRGNGHFWLWGYYDILAQCHPMLLELGFRHRQTIIWDKGMQVVAGRATRKYQMYPNVTEFCVNYVKWNREDLRQTLKARQMEMRLTAGEINDHMGVRSNGGGMWSIYTGENVCAQIPTRERWEKMMGILHLDIPYEDVQMVWNSVPGITNVWSDIPAPDSRGRVNPSQKPLEALRRIVLPSTLVGDRVLDLFAGSLGVASVCQELGRGCTSIESDANQVQQALALRGIPQEQVST